MNAVFDILNQQEVDYLKKNGIIHVRWKQNNESEIEVWFDEKVKKK